MEKQEKYSLKNSVQMLAEELAQFARNELVGWISERTDDGFVFALAGGQKFAVTVKSV